MARLEEFEDIESWKKAYAVTVQIYKLTEAGEFSRDFGLRDQIRRASVSIMANIAEGYGRKSNTEFANFLNIARGSSHEAQSHLHIALGLGYLKREDFDELYNSLAEISRLTLGLAKYLRGHQKK
ncbi:MAG: four helix bundle protein [Pyrinomonadaceae bacterium]